jgi:ferric enterobactin receptor
MPYYRKRAIVILSFFFTVNISWGQQTYEFCVGCSDCHQYYIEYAPNHDYLTRNRPYMMIIGLPGQDAKTAFDKDTLKNIPSFYSYLFIYVPNTGAFHYNRFSCIEPLMSLITSNYVFGRKNLFLDVKDTTFTMNEIKSSTLDFAFNTIHIEKHNKPTSDSIMATSFKATKIDPAKYSLLPDPSNDMDDDDDVSDSISGAYAAVNKKTYFGPPVTHNITITGIARDAKTGEVLPFATISILGGSNGVTTNVDGLFTLLGVPSDTSTLELQYMGYQQTLFYLSPQTPKKNINILAYPNANALKAVSITANRYELMKVDKTTVGVLEMTPAEIKKLPSLGAPDIMRSFQLMPGISAANESSSGLYVLGGTPDQNLVLFDGFTVYQVDHLYGFFSAFNANALKDVQLYKGAYQAKYGGRLSSVTDITGKDGNQNKFNMGASISFLSYDAFAEIPIGDKFSSIICFRKSYQGIIYNEIFDKFNNNSSSANTSAPSSGGPKGGPGGFSQSQTTPTSYFYDLNGKFTYRPTDKDVISLSFYNGQDYLNNSLSISAPSFGPSGADFSFSNTDLTNYGNTGGSLKWSRKWSDKFYGSTLISYSNYFSDRTLSNSRSTTSSSGSTSTSSMGLNEDNNLKDYSFKSDYQWDIFKGSQLQFGVFSTYYDIKYTYSQNDTSTIIDRHNFGLLGGGYVQDKISLFNSKLNIVPGVRESYYSPTNKIYYEPRASIVYSLTDEITLKAATGDYFQYANRVTREDILSGSRDFWILSDGNRLPVSSSTHYLTSISYEKKNYLFSVEAYYKQISNLTQYSLRFDPSPTSISYSEDFYTGSGYSKGLEFLIQKKVGKLSGWISYTLSSTMNYFPVFSSTYYAANQDAPNEVHVVGMYKWKKWDLSLTWIYATGLPYTAPAGTYGVTLLNGSTQYYYTVTSENSLRLPDYHRMDVAANYTLFVGSGKRRHEIGYIGFSIFNVYDHKNVWYRVYTVESGKIIQTDVDYLLFTPNITLSLKLH